MKLRFLSCFIALAVCGVATQVQAQVATELRRFDRSWGTYALSPDGKTIAITGQNYEASGRGESWDKTEIFDIRTGKLKRTFPGSPVMLGFLSDGRSLVSQADGKAAIQIRDIVSGRLIKNYAPPVNHFFLENGRILGAKRNGQIQLLDTGTSRVLQTLNFPALSAMNLQKKIYAVPSNDKITIRGHGIQQRYLLYKGIESVVISPDGKTVATGGWDAGDIVQIWDTQSGKLLHSMRGSYDGQCHANSLAFSPDSRVLASNTGAGTVRLWDVKTGMLLQHLSIGTEDSQVTFSNDGWLLAAKSRNSVKVWNVNTNALPANQVRILVLDSSGKMISHNAGIMIKPGRIGIPTTAFADAGVLVSERLKEKAVVLAYPDSDYALRFPFGQNSFYYLGNEEDTRSPHFDTPVAIQKYQQIYIGAHAVKNDFKEIFAMTWNGREKTVTLQKKG